METRLLAWYVLCVDLTRAGKGWELRLPLRLIEPRPMSQRIPAVELNSFDYLGLGRYGPGSYGIYGWSYGDLYSWPCGLWLDT